MISKTVLILLIVCTLLVADSQGWRRRRRSRRSRGGLWRTATGLAKGYLGGKLVGSALWAFGKRDARCADLLTPDQVQQLATDLQNTCDDIPVNLAADGLNFDEVKGVFNESDANGDGKLLDAELKDFATAIQTVEACAEVEAEIKP